MDWSDENPNIVVEMLDGTQDDGEKQMVNYLMYSTKQLTPENVSEISQTQGIRYCDASSELLAVFDELSLFAGKVPIEEDFRKMTKVLGVWGTEDNEFFTSGILSLSEGRHLTPEDTGKALISRDLAEKNGVGVGDYITARSTKGEEIKVQIIGLFVPAETESFTDMVTSYDKIQNRIFADLSTVIKIEDSPAIQGFSQIHVTVKDPRDMEQIVSDVKKIPSIDWDAFTVNVDNEAFQKASQPLAALSSLIVTLLIIIVIVSAVILALILTLWTKTRVHEIGVFLSLGMKKSAIIGQFLTEVLLIAALAFGLSFFTSSAIAGQIGNQLLKQSEQNGADDRQGDAASDRGGSAVAGDDDSLVKPDTSMGTIQVSVGFVSLVELYLIGFAVIIAAVGVSSVTVMRLKPREILSKMS